MIMSLKNWIRHSIEFTAHIHKTSHRGSQFKWDPSSKMFSSIMSLLLLMMMLSLLHKLNR